MNPENLPLPTHERALEAAVVIKAAAGTVPELALVLGSGLGVLADGMTEKVVLPYARVPHLGRPTAAGHAGNVVVGTLGATRMLVLQGRLHHYEGHDLEAATFPVRVLARLGVRTLILTAAVGGIRSDLNPGDVVCVADHLNLLGANPLRGPNDERLGVRFPDMTEVYSARLRALAAEEAVRRKLVLKSGVYACVPGPSYETPAEVRMLRTLGADVVGMSTVPEAIVARHERMDVLAFALVSNAAAGLSGRPITHAEVLDAGRRAAGALGTLIAGVAARIAPSRPVVPSGDGGEGVRAET